VYSLNLDAAFVESWMSASPAIEQRFTAATRLHPIARSSCGEDARPGEPISNYEVILKKTIALEVVRPSYHAAKWGEHFASNLRRYRYFTAPRPPLLNALIVMQHKRSASTA
jgi:hypothetical protein